MNLSFFNLFMSPCFLGIPLILLSMLFPALLLPTLNNWWITNCLSTLHLWFFHVITKQLMMSLNKYGYKWALILTSLMVWLLTSLLPYTFTATTQLLMNMALEFPFWLTMLLTGLQNQPSASLGHLLPKGTPTPLISALIMMKTTSLLLRPLALGVHLTANLTAGHLLIQLISMSTTALLLTMPTVSILTMLILLLLTILEAAVAMIQVYVFILLLSLYLQENI